MNDDIGELIAAAAQVQGEFPLSTVDPDLTAASVGAALRTVEGNIYTGVCVDVDCGIGFCAEHAAAAEMLKGRESQVVMMAAVNGSGVLPPCGRCRELIAQLHDANMDALVVLSETETVPLRQLLPHHWRGR